MITHRTGALKNSSHSQNTITCLLAAKRSLISLSFGLSDRDFYTNFEVTTRLITTEKSALRGCSVLTIPENSCHWVVMLNGRDSCPSMQSPPHIQVGNNNLNEETRPLANQSLDVLRREFDSSRTILACGCGFAQLSGIQYPHHDRISSARQASSTLGTLKLRPKPSNRAELSRTIRVCQFLSSLRPTDCVRKQSTLQMIADTCARTHLASNSALESDLRGALSHRSPRCSNLNLNFRNRVGPLGRSDHRSAYLDCYCTASKFFFHGTANDGVVDRQAEACGTDIGSKPCGPSQ